MALINDPRLFTGGSERFDTRPHVALYAQLKAKEQARNDAFDEYIRNLNKNINPAGLRNADRPAFEQKLREWQDYGMKNREALRNPRKDNGGASMQFQAGYQDLQNLISESKGEEEKKKPLIEIMTDPNKRDRLSSDDLLQKIQSHDTPLYAQDKNTGILYRDPNRRSFNITDINYDPKPFEQDKFSKGLDDIKASQSSQSIKKLPGFKEEVTTTAVFSPEDKEAVAYRAVAQFGQDKGFKKFIKELPEKERAELKSLYETEFKEPATDDGHLAAAYGLKVKQENSTKREIKDDSFAQRKELARLNDAYTKGRMYMRRAWQQTDKATQDTWVDDYIGKVVNTSKVPENRVEYKYKDGRVVKGYKVPMDELLGDAVGIDNEKNQGQLIVTDDGEFVTAFFNTDDKYAPLKKGESYSIDENRTRRYDRIRLKLNIAKKAAGTTGTNKEMSATDFGEEEETGILD